MLTRVSFGLLKRGVNVLGINRPKSALRYSALSSQGRNRNTLYSKVISPASSELNWSLLVISTLLSMSILIDYGDCEGNTDPPASFPRLLQELSNVLSADQIELDEGERRVRGKPWNSYHSMVAYPHIILYPTSTEQVSQIVRLCNEHQMPIVAFGGGTSLEGQTLTLKGGVSLDFSHMKEIIEINEADLDVTVQAGLGYVELNEVLKPKGLWFPLDPGPGASVGGMCACRCSGSTAVRYGSMRENVLSLTAVLANGDVVKTGTRARKSSAGYDLTRLFIGSEGTLGIITEATLKVYGIPKVSRAIRITYPQGDKGIYLAALTARDTLNCGVTVGRCELLDAGSIYVANKANNVDAADYAHQTDSSSHTHAHPKSHPHTHASVLPWPESTTLLYEVTGLSEQSVQEQAQVIVNIAKQHGAKDIMVYSNEKQAQEVWKVRKEVLWSAMSVFSDREVMITDVCVPLSNLPTLITETQEQLKAAGLPCPIIAHAGDGNFHVLLFFNPNDPAEVKKAKQLATSMALRAIALGGTCTGEHGVGVGKMHLLHHEYTPNTLGLMRTIKTTLDPGNLLNPGKVVDVVQTGVPVPASSNHEVKQEEKKGCISCQGDTCSRKNN